MRSVFVPVCVALGSAVIAVPCSAQGFGLGARMSLVRGNVETNTSAERFIGGQMRLSLSRSAPRFRWTAARTTTTRSQAHGQTLQGSLLLYPGRTTRSAIV
jgi:hypothetical protein